MPAVNLLIKPASGICNMQCDYCFYCDEAEKRKQYSYGMMSESTLQNVIRKTFLYAEHDCTIAFQGGEPTLIGLEFYEKVIEYVNKYNRKNISVHFALQTNGFAVDEKWCEFFKENNFLVGLSIDGLQKTHDRFRHDHTGNGTYERVLATSKLFDSHQIEYNILTVVNSETAKNIVPIYKEFKANGWGYMQFIPCLDPLGETRGMKPYSLTPGLYGTFLTQLFDLWYKDWKRDRQPYIRQFENYVGILMGYLPESCEQRGICGIQNVVEADGGVYPCDFYVLDDFLLGNLNQNSMAEIQEKRKEIGFIERSRNHSEKCKNCRYFNICRGGCYRHREDEIDNYFCEGYYRFFEACYPKIEEVAKFLKMKK